MRAPTTSNRAAKGARKGSNGSDSHKKLHSDGSVDARRGWWSGCREAGGRLEEGTTYGSLMSY